MGGSAIAALLALLLRPSLAGLVSIGAGIVITVFALVEITVVGLTIVDYRADQPLARLQIIYLPVGFMEITLGLELWRATEAAPLDGGSVR